MGKSKSLAEAFAKLENNNKPQNRLTNLEKSVYDYGEGWQSKADTDALLKSIHSEKLRAALNSNDELLKKLNDITNDISSQSKLYSKFNSADEYDKAKKNSVYYTKSQRFKTAEDVDEYIKSDKYLNMRKSGAISDEENEYYIRRRTELADSKRLSDEIAYLENFIKQGEYDLYDHMNPNTPNPSAQNPNVPSANLSPNPFSFDPKVKKTGKEAKALEENIKKAKDRLIVLKAEYTQKKNQEEFDAKWAKEFEDFLNNENAKTGDIDLSDVVGDSKYKKYLSDDEKKFIPYLATQNEEKAKEYYDDLIDVRLDKEYNQELFDEEYNYAAADGWQAAWASAKSVAYNLGSGFEWIGNVLAGNWNRRSTLSTRASGATEGTKSHWDGSQAEEIFDILYDTGMSGLEMAPIMISAFATGGTTAVAKTIAGAGTAILAGSASASKQNELLDRGVTGFNVFLGALAAGTAEYVFEKWSIDSMLDMKSFKGLSGVAKAKAFTGNVFKSIGINASEELNTELANIVLDDIINPSLSQYAHSVQQYYMKDNLSINEAKKKAAADLGIQIALATASGGLMGLGFGSVTSAGNYVFSKISDYKAGKLILSEPSRLVEFKALVQSSDFEGVKKAVEKLNNKSKASKIGNVFNQTVLAAMEDSQSQLITALKANGATNGGTNSAKGWADYIYKTAVAPKGSKSTMQDSKLRVNKIAGDVYTAFVDEGKYGGDTLLALNEMVTPVNAKSQPVTNEQISENINQDIADRNEIREEIRPTFGTNELPAEVAENLKKMQGSTVMGPVTEAYRRSVTENREKERPTPQRLTKDQGYVKEVAAKLGRTVVFEHTEQTKRKKVDGYIDKKGTIHIDYSNKSPLQFVFKHELTHFLEKNKATYSDFANAVMDSEVFSEWVKSKGYESVDAYRRSIIDLYLKIDPQFNEPKANKEMLANFVSEKLFGNDLASLEKLLQAMEPKQRRTFIEFIRDFIKYLKEKFIKDTSLTAQIERFEKEFIKAYKAAEAEFEQQKNAENNGGEEFSLDMYSEHQKANWSRSSKIVVYESDAQLMDFVERAMNESEYKAKVYFGMVGEHLAKRIQADTGLSLLGRNVTLRADNVKKVLKPTAHGDSTFEQNRGQEAIKKEDFCKIPIVIGEPDTIKRSTDDYKGKPAVIFEKTIDNQKITIVAVDSGGSLDLFVQTMYLGKKKGNIADMLNGQTSEQTSKTSVGTVPNNNVPQKSNVVNSNISQNAQNDTDSVEFLYVGEKSKTADKLKLATAKQMLKDGADSETVRKETGWFKGYDGKWRFEISDKDVEFYDDVKRYIEAFVEFGAVGKEMLKTYEPDDDLRRRFIKALKKLDETPKITETTLGKLIKHDALFAAYPELKDYKVIFKSEPNLRGGYNVKTKDITIDNFDAFESVDDCMKTVIHETQHAVQHLEGYAFGASNVYWKREIANGNIPRYSNGRRMSADKAYRLTAGEIEARDAVNRIKLTEEQRETKKPDVYRKNVVFLPRESVLASDTVQYSIPSDHEYVYQQGKASFTEERINNLFDEHSLGDGKRAEHSNAYVGYISPEDFVNLTANKNIRGRVEDEAYVLNEDELKNEKETPFLEYDPATGDVVNHEGRHRMVALQADGIKSVAIVIKPSNDSFERRTVQDISLTGQNFAGGKASGNVTVKNAIPLSEKYRAEAVAQFAQNPDADVRYSLSMEDADTLLDMYEHKQITREEYLSRLNQSRSRKAETPLDIARMTKEDANTTPPLKRKQGEVKGDSESKLYTSLQKSDIFNDEFKAEFKNNSFIKKYQSVGNAETMREAAKELDAGGQAYVDEWNRKDAKHASLIDIAVGFILLDRYQRIGDKDSAAGVGEKLRQMATASGQQVQIFSILGRFDADTMVRYAQKELDGAFKVFKEEKTQRWLDANADRFNLTEDDIEFIRRRTLQAAEMPEGRPKDILLAEIATRIQDKMPAKSGQGIKAYQRICMLLNAKTNIRNFMSNATSAPAFMFADVFGSVIDRHYAKKTGVRTTGMFGSGGIAENFKAFGKGAKNTYEDWRRHINTRELDRYRRDLGRGVVEGKAFNENHKFKPLNAVTKKFNELDRLTSFLLEMGDRPFYEMWFTNSLNNQIKLNKVSEPTAEMIEIATQEALQRTWQDNNAWTRSVSKLKEVGNIVNLNVIGMRICKGRFVSLPDYGLGDVILKFTKTPANLSKAILDFSPVGLIKACASSGTKFKMELEKGNYDVKLQKQFVDELSKGISGTIIQIMLYWFASMGWMVLKGKGDDDDDVSAFEKYIMGIPEYSVSFFGSDYITYEWNQPFGAFMATVADYMKAKKEKPDNEWYNNIFEGIKAGGDVLLRQSFLQSLQKATKTEGLWSPIIAAFMDDPSVYVPQLIAQAATLNDDYRRSVYVGDDFDITSNEVKNKIPGLRETLEKDVDVLGRDVPNSQGDWVNAFLNPGNIYTDTSNEIAREVYSIYKQTGNATVIPRKAENSIDVKNKKHSFTAEEKANYQRIMGRTSADIIDKLLDEVDYVNLPDSQKVDLITDVYDYATAKAKSDVIYSYEIISAMYGGSISRELYNRLTEAEKKKLAELYFMDDYYDSKYKPKFEQGEEAEYFLEKILDKYGKEEKQSKKDKYKQKELDKILN